MSALDLRWDIPSVLPLVDFSSSKLKALRNRTMSLLKEKMINNRSFAIKDPRLCLLLPFWLRVASELGVKTSFIVVVRNPLDVAQSLKYRNDFDKNKSLIIWRNHNFLILNQLYKRRRRSIYIDYSKFLQEPYQEINRLVTFVSGRVPSAKKISSMEWFVKEFINPDLCHSESSLQALRKESDKVPGTIALYQCLLEFATSGWSREKAGAVLNTIELLDLEAESYRAQLGIFKQEMQAALEERTRILQEDKNSALEHLEAEKDRVFQDISERKDKEIQELALHMVTEVKDLSRQKDAELQNLSERKDKEIQELAVHMMREVKDLSRQKEAELQEYRRQKEAELQEYRRQKDIELQEYQRTAGADFERAARAA